MATCLLELNRFDDALIQFERILGDEIAAYGAEDPQLAITHGNLAKCLAKLDRPSDAAEHRRRCWALEAARDGLEATGTLQTAVALTTDLLAAGKPEQAKEVIAESLSAVASAEVPDEERDEWCARLKALQAKQRDRD